MLKLKDNNGFTLLEVLVSFTLLSITVLVFFAVFPRLANVSNLNEENIVAANLAKKVLSVMVTQNEEILLKEDDLFQESYLRILEDSEDLNDFLSKLNIDEVEVIDDITYYHINASNEQFVVSIQNITKDHSPPSLLAVNVKVLNADKSKVLAENLGFINGTVVATIDDEEEEEEEEEEDNTNAGNYLDDILQLMKNNNDITKNNFKNKQEFFNIKENNHVNAKDRDAYILDTTTFYEAWSNECPLDIDTCYKVNDNGNEIIFSILNILDKSNKFYEIRVDIYDSVDDESPFESGSLVISKK
jgi:type II secretory pathway pseudopilin PulG